MECIDSSITTTTDTQPSYNQPVYLAHPIKNQRT